MTLAGATPATDDLWSPVLASIQAGALDCMQANLAMLADRRHPGAHLALGAYLRFKLTIEPDGRPAVAAALDDRLTEAQALLGMRVTARREGLDGTGLRDLAAEAPGHAPLYVVADAYSMSWVPYAGQRHLDHSFLLLRADSRQALIADGYQNNTEWGQAQPGVWLIPATDLDAAACGGQDGGATVLELDAGSPPRLDPDVVLAGNATAMAAARPDIERYAAAARAAVSDPTALARLVLDVWLLSRSRQLHAAWLASVGDRPDGTAAAEQLAQAWLRLSTLAFVAERRARRGQAVSPAIADQVDELLRADIELARQLAPAQAAPSATAVAPPVTPAATGRGDPRAVVTDELGAITGLNVASLEPGTELRSLPGFSSFRLVDLIERAEQRLGVELDPDDLTADSLRTISSLCDLFAAATAATPELAS